MAVEQMTPAERQGLNLYQKLLEVQKNVTYFQQNKQGDKFKYVGSSDVLTAIRSAMDSVGLILSVSVTGSRLHLDAAYSGKQHLTEIDIALEWINADKPEERLAWQMYGQGIDSGEKGVGKALTYAEKYGLLKFFHVGTDKDDPDSFQAKHDNDEVPATRQARASAASPVEDDAPPDPQTSGNGNGKRFSNPGALFEALAELGYKTTAERDALRKRLGFECPWPEMGEAGFAQVYATAVAEKGGN